MLTDSRRQFECKMRRTEQQMQNGNGKGQRKKEKEMGV